MLIPYSNFEDFIEGTNEVFLSINIIAKEGKYYGIIKMVAAGINPVLNLVTHTKLFNQVYAIPPEIQTQEAADKWQEDRKLESIQLLKTAVTDIRIIEANLEG